LREAVAVTLQPALVQTGTRDEEGQLVFVDGKLAAVLVLLSDQHEDAAGQWFLEHGFGRLNEHLTFGDLDAATSWIAQQCRDRSGAADVRRSR
jgi:hypothetical protein